MVKEVRQHLSNAIMNQTSGEQKFCMDCEIFCVYIIFGELPDFISYSFVRFLQICIVFLENFVVTPE